MDPQDQGGDSHAVEIDIRSLALELRQLPAGSNSSAQLAGGYRPCPITISEVPILTRNVDPVEYDSQHVAIGPYHRIRSLELARDNDKKRGVRAVVSAAAARLGTTEERFLEQMVETYVQEVALLERQARSCYGHEFDKLTSTEFVRMLLLDGCYLLAMFGGIDEHADGRRRSDEAAATANGHAQGGAAASDKPIEVVRDTFYLAENQVPFFVIDKIHQLTFPDTGSRVSAAHTMALHVRKQLQKMQYSLQSPDVLAPPGPGNLLHLLHMHFRRTPAPSPTNSSIPAAGGEPRVRRWHTATEYHFAGVRFKKRRLGTDGCQSILDVRLGDSGGGALEIPFLDIDARTWPMLRNLMALEQSNAEAAGSDVTAYCVFLSQLACNEGDVELLSRRGVISHGCGNHGEVAGFLSDLCKGIKFDPDDGAFNYLKPEMQALEMRFQSRWRRWLVWLRQKYFKNPWLAVGLAAAAVGLACAVVQAVYSVLSYKH